MRKEETIKLLKCVVGSVVSVLIADYMKIQFAYAAGIITILTIQDTKKETIKIAEKRMVIFAVMTLLSVMIFPIAGYHVWAFGILLIPYLFFCTVLDMKEAITPMAVLCTHYITAKSCSWGMIWNEFAMLVVGVGVGVGVNLFMPDSRDRLIRYKQRVDGKIANILERMALYMEKTDKSDYTGDCFYELDDMLDDLKKEAVYYSNNHFLGEHDYYYEYMLMRGRQCSILKRIYCDIIRLTGIPKQVGELAGFIRKVAKGFERESDVKNLLEDINSLEKSYAIQTLPQTREEFENRAMLYHIMEDIRAFLSISHNKI